MAAVNNAGGLTSAIEPNDLVRLFMSKGKKGVRLSSSSNFLSLLLIVTCANADLLCLMPLKPVKGVNDLPGVDDLPVVNELVVHESALAHPIKTRLRLRIIFLLLTLKAASLQKNLLLKQGLF